jgi:hypothetical protein
MRLEYLPAGPPDCPLVRLFDFEADEVIRLRGLVTELADGSRNHLAVHELSGIEAVRECRLVFEVGPQSVGLVEAQPPNSLRCILAPDGWREVAELMEPFCRPGGARGFQWLHSAGPISLLLSHDGRW